MPTATSKTTSPTLTDNPPDFAPVSDPALDFTITAASFKEALGILNRFIPAKTTLPVLGMVKIEATNGALTLTGTNLEATAVATLGSGNIHKDGGACVDARSLADWIRLQNDEQQVDFVLKAHRSTAKAIPSYKLLAKSGSSSFEFSTIPTDDFPATPDFSGCAEIHFPSDELVKAIDQVAYACAPDDTRPVLSGVQMTLTAAGVTAAAADGFRLAFRTWKSDAPIADAISFIVPGKYIEDLGRALAGVDSKACTITYTSRVVDVLDNNHKQTGETRLDPHQLAIKFDRYTLISRLIEGAFPDYNRIVPSDRDIKADLQIDKKHFTKAVRGALIAARSNSSIVRVSREESSTASVSGALDYRMKVWAQSAEGDIGEDHIEVDWIISPAQFDFPIAFNGKYLVDMLDAMPSDKLRVRLAGTGSPGVFLPVGAAGSLTDVIMPMSVAR